MVDTNWSWGAGLLLLTTAVACGGEDTGEPGEPEPPTSCPRVEHASIPTLTWSACDPAPLECASLEVPVDHTKPGDERYVLDLVRVPAADPEKRRGVLVVQTGGPGGSSVDLVRDNFALFAASMPDVYQGYDVIGMDGRAVSLDTRADCFGEELRRKRSSLDHTPKDAAGWAAVDAFWKEVAADCNAQHPIERVATFGTCQSVSDFDLLRAALGESELNFLGLSYGTFVGAAYASTYPEHVRAFVLDAAVLPTVDYPAIRTDPVRARGYDEGLRRAAAACGASTSCPFAGMSAEQIVDELVALIESLDQNPLVVGGREVNDATLFLAAKRALNTSTMAGFWPAVAAAKAGDGASLLTQADLLGPSLGRNYNIILNDRPCPPGFDVGAAQASAEATAAEAPIFGRTLAEDAFICLGWPEPPVRQPVMIEKTTAPPLLIVGGNNDVLTPGAHADGLAQLLGNGSHVLKHDLEVHVALPFSECVRSATSAFLLDPTGPAPSACSGP